MSSKVPANCMIPWFTVHRVQINMVALSLCTCINVGAWMWGHMCHLVQLDFLYRHCCCKWCTLWTEQSTQLQTQYDFLLSYSSTAHTRLCLFFVCVAFFFFLRNLPQYPGFRTKENDFSVDEKHIKGMNVFSVFAIFLLEFIINSIFSKADFRSLFIIY